MYICIYSSPSEAFKGVNLGMFINYLYLYVLQDFLRNIPCSYGHLDNTIEFHDMATAKFVYIIHNTHSILLINHT
jgi:hypothetical protein